MAPGSELGTSTHCIACCKTFSKSVWQHLLIPAEEPFWREYCVYSRAPYQNYGCLVSGYYSELSEVQTAYSCDHLLLEYYCLLRMNGRISKWCL